MQRALKTLAYVWESEATIEVEWSKRPFLTYINSTDSILFQIQTLHFSVQSYNFKWTVLASYSIHTAKWMLEYNTQMHQSQNGISPNTETGDVANARQISCRFFYALTESLRPGTNGWQRTDYIGWSLMCYWTPYTVSARTPSKCSSCVLHCFTAYFMF